MQTSLKLCVFFLGMAVPALAQNAKPTEIRGVCIGETVQEFQQSAEFAKSGCQGIASPRIQEMCNDGMNKWSEPGMKVEVRLEKDSSIYFEDGAVVQVRVAFDSYADALRAATTKFGQPSTEGFDGEAAAASGTTTGKASVWKMPDGSDVLAYENAASTDAGVMTNGYVVLVKRAPEKKAPEAPEL